jgi:enoyl-CoA hydratase/carnithine racemase
MTDVRVRREPQVMHVVLDGESTLNSLDPRVLDGLEVALDEAEADHDLRAAVVTGVGERAFSVGMDLTFLGTCFADPVGTFVPFLRRYHAVLSRLERLPVPVIARVNGLARAGGFELILACDLVVVADDVRVGDVHLAFGVPPGGGASQRAVRKLGEQRAKALVLTSDWLDGATMVRWGLALSSVARTGLDDEVERLLASLRGRSRSALAVTKAAMSAAPDLPLDAGLDYELELFERLLSTTSDLDEGYRAFVEGREPTWGSADVSHLR